MGKYAKYRVFRGHRGCVNSVVFSDDGNTVITGSDDTCVNYYSVESGELVSSFATAHTRNIFFAKDIEFSQGTRLLTCAADGCVMVTDTSRPHCYDRVYKHQGRAHRIALVPGSPDCFLSTGEDGSCCIFDLRLNRRGICSAPSAAADAAGRHSQIAGRVTFKDEYRVPRSIYSVDVNPAAPWSVCLGGEYEQAQQYVTSCPLCMRC
jgi:WD40 repeat protein